MNKRRAANCSFAKWRVVFAKLNICAKKLFVSKTAISTRSKTTIETPQALHLIGKYFPNSI